MKFRYLILSLVAILIVSGFELSANDKGKAEYIYLEAINQYNLENYGGFYELMGRAYEMDSTNSAIAYYYGYTRLLDAGGSKEDVQASLHLMRELADTPSESNEEVATYASLLNRFGYYGEAIDVWRKLQAKDPENLNTMVNLAESYTQNNQLTEAIEQYNMFEQSQGLNPELSMRKISLYLALKDTANVFGEGHKLLKDAPENSSYLQIMGNIHRELGAVDSALVYYNRAASVDPENGYINLDLVKYYAAIGDSINYDIQVEKLLLSKNLEVEHKLKFLHEYISDLLKSEGNTDKVESLFAMLLDVHPHEGEIHQLYADYLLVREDYVNALEQISYQLDQDPTNAEMWQKMMFVALMAENYEKARYAAEKAIYYNPDNIELYVYIAPIYLQLKDNKKALELYNKALERVDKTDYKRISILHGGLGDAYQFEGDTLRAVEEYKLALKADDGNLYVMNNYAYLLAEMGTDLELAEKMSRLSVQEIPDSPSNLDTYAWVLFKLERYDEALTQIERAFALENDPSSDLLDHYGDILFMVGEQEMAVEYWEKASKLDPDSQTIKMKIKERKYINK